MAPPILLVADDLATIAAVKRVLGREGYEVILATSAADAIIAWGHHLPGLVLLQPSVEGERGGVVLEELQNHPDARLLRVVLLGETIPGFAVEVEPLPLDGPHFATTIADNLRAAKEAESWQVTEQAAPPEPAPAPGPRPPVERWRATAPPEVSAEGPPSTEAVPEPSAVSEDTGASPLSLQLFGDLAPADVAPDEPSSREGTTAISAPLSDSSSDPTAPPQVRQAAPAAPPPPRAPTTTPPGPRASASDSDVASALARATAVLEEARSQAGAQRRAEAAAAQEYQNQLVALGREVERAEAEGQRERELRVHAEDELKALRAERGREAEALHQARTNADAEVAAERAASAQALETQRSAAERRAADLERVLRERDEALEATANRELQLTGALENNIEELSLEREQHRSMHQQAASARADLERQRDALAAALQTADRARQTAEEATAEVRRQASLEREALSAELATAQHARGATEQVLEEAQRQLTAERDARDEAGRILTKSREGFSSTLQTVEELQRARDENAAALEAARLELETTRQELARLHVDFQDVVKREQEAQGTLGTGRAAAALQREALETQVASLEASLETHLHERAELTELKSTLASTRRELDETVAELEATRERYGELGLSLEAEKSSHAQALAAAEAAQLRLATELSTQAEVTAQIEGERDLRQRELEYARSEQDKARAALDETSRELADTTSELEATRARRDAGEVERAAAEQTLAAELARLRDALATSEQRAVDASETLEASQRALSAAAAARDAAVARGIELDAELQRTAAQLSAVRAEAEVLAHRAEGAEAAARASLERSVELEHRAVMPLELPGKTVVSLSRTGEASLEALAKLVARLVSAQGNTRLELGVVGGTRTLWFERGLVVGAESSFEHETLVARARRDGLIDARQEAELRLLRQAPPQEQLAALKVRGFIRDAEVVPLVQRCAEQVALEALSEELSQYRLSDEGPTAHVLRVTVPRATLPLLAEGLRRAVPADALLERLGGGEAIPHPGSAPTDLRALGFSERERTMLSWVDGEATVEDITLASGLKPEQALRTLHVGAVLGLITLEPPKSRPTTVTPELDVRRLEAKFQESQDADYFSILGLSRSATTDEVRRAYQQLASEFNPLRFSGHTDAGVQQRVQVVANLLEEAARALDDDRRRQEYARHLLD